MILSFYRIDETVPMPNFGTTHATCFDLRFCPRDQASVKGYNSSNEPIVRVLGLEDQSLTISPGDRILVPTGLVFSMVVVDSEPGLKTIFPLSDPIKHSPYSIRIHARSGMALKHGLVLANGEGVVDADYQEEVFVLLTNISTVPVKILPNERIAQAEVVQNLSSIIKMYEAASWPAKLAERSGGFGSTGKA